jgi:hypothetical protein
MNVADDLVEPYRSLRSGRPTLNGDPSGTLLPHHSPGHAIIYAEVT